MPKICEFMARRAVGWANPRRRSSKKEDPLRDPGFPF